jgi:hypothetical protein
MYVYLYVECAYIRTYICVYACKYEGMYAYVGMYTSMYKEYIYNTNIYTVDTDVFVSIR